jgi:hypothetical protein
MFLMYNQINGTGGMTINSIQNRLLTDKFLTLTENKDYEGLTNIVDGYIYRNGCSLNEGDYHYICLLKELNDLGIDVISHKYIDGYYNNLDDISIYHVTLRYKGKEEIIEMTLSSDRKILKEIYINSFRISNNVTCSDLYNPFSWCYNEEEQMNYYVWEMNLDSENFFPKDINEKIVKLFSSSIYVYD